MLHEALHTLLCTCVGDTGSYKEWLTGRPQRVVPPSPPYSDLTCPLHSQPRSVLGPSGVPAGSQHGIQSHRSSNLTGFDHYTHPVIAVTVQVAACLEAGKSKVTTTTRHLHLSPHHQAHTCVCQTCKELESTRHVQLSVNPHGMACCTSQAHACAHTLYTHEEKKECREDEVQVPSRTAKSSSCYHHQCYY